MLSIIEAIIIVPINIREYAHWVVLLMLRQEYYVYYQWNVNDPMYYLSMRVCTYFFLVYFYTCRGLNTYISVSDLVLFWLLFLAF